MIKKNIYGDNLKERLLAGARDKLYNFMLADGTVRGAVIHGKRLVNEMRANHELGILETLVLGHAYLASGLMSANLKGNDRLGLHIECSGPIKGLDVEANAFGEIRGYLKNVPIPIEKPLEDFNLSPFFGAGILRVTRCLENARQPFTGQTVLQYGAIGKDLAYYFNVSEQVPTAFNLSIKFDRRGEVAGAGGLFLQVMPAASDKTISRLESMVLALPSIGAAFAEGRSPEDLVNEEFKKFSPKIVGNYRIEFMCRCSVDRTRGMLSMLPFDDLGDIRENGPFPLEMRCHHCNTRYLFSREDIQKIYAARFPDN